MTGEFGQGRGDVGGVRRLESQHGKWRDFKAEIKLVEPLRSWNDGGCRTPLIRNMEPSATCAAVGETIENDCWPLKL